MGSFCTFPFGFVPFLAFLAKTFPLTVFLLETASSRQGCSATAQRADVWLFKTWSWNVSQALVSFQAELELRAHCTESLAFKSDTYTLRAPPPARGLSGVAAPVFSSRLPGSKSVTKPNKVLGAGISQPGISAPCSQLLCTLCPVV